MAAPAIEVRQKGGLGNWFKSQLRNIAPFLTALPDYTFPARRDSAYRVSLRQHDFEAIGKSCPLQGRQLQRIWRVSTFTTWACSPDRGVAHISHFSPRAARGRWRNCLSAPSGSVMRHPPAGRSSPRWRRPGAEEDRGGAGFRRWPGPPGASRTAGRTTGRSNRVPGAAPVHDDGSHEGRRIPSRGLLAPHGYRGRRRHGSTMVPTIESAATVSNCSLRRADCRPWSLAQWPQVLIVSSTDACPISRARSLIGVGEDERVEALPASR